jgi:hypothetical protein
VFAVIANLAPVAGASRTSPVIGLSMGGLSVWAAIMWFRAGRPFTLGPRDIWLRISWLMIAVLLIWCVVVDSIVGSGIYGLRLIAYGSAFLFWLCLGLIASRATISMLAVAYWGLIVLAVLSIPALFYSDGWRRCTTGALEKCSLADGLFKSIYDSENYIALLASVTLIACVCSMRRLELLAGAAFCVLIIVATGSRTSMLAIAAAAGCNCWRSCWSGGGSSSASRRPSVLRWRWPASASPHT